MRRRTERITTRPLLTRVLSVSRKSLRPGYPNTARVADSPPEKPEREDWISAASIEFFWRLTDPSIDCEGWRL